MKTVCESLNWTAMGSFHMEKRHFSSSVHTVFRRNICTEAKRIWLNSTRIEWYAHTMYKTWECRAICYFVFVRFASYRHRIAQRISCDRFVSIFGPLFDTQTTIHLNLYHKLTRSLVIPITTRSLALVRLLSTIQYEKSHSHACGEPIAGDVDVALLSTVVFYMHGFWSIILLQFSFSFSVALFYFISF